MSAAMKAELPGAWQVMVRANPANGRRNLYAGAHASHVIGWPRDEGREFIRRLNEFATRRNSATAINGAPATS